MTESRIIALLERIAAAIEDDAVGRLHASLAADREPTPDTPDAAPVWPTAPFVWHDGQVWTRDEDGDYGSPRMSWAERGLQSTFGPARDAYARFAREAVPVTVAPAREWEAWRKSTAHRECHHTEADLMNATDTMTGW